MSAPATRVDGDIITAAIWTSDVANGPVRCYFQSTADSAAVTATGDQPYSIAFTPVTSALFNVVGRRIRVHAFGVHTTGANAGTVGLKVRIGGTVVIAAYGTSYNINTTNFGWELDASLVVRTTGASATLARTIKTFTDFDLVSVREGADLFIPSTLSAAVDLTGTPVVEVAVNFSASGNSSTMKSMAVFVEN